MKRICPICKEELKPEDSKVFYISKTIHIKCVKNIDKK